MFPKWFTTKKYYCYQNALGCQNMVQTVKEMAADREYFPGLLILRHLARTRKRLLTSLLP